MQQVEHVIEFFTAQAKRWPRETVMHDTYATRAVRYIELSVGYRDHTMAETPARKRELYS